MKFCQLNLLLLFAGFSLFSFAQQTNTGAPSMHRASMANQENIRLLELRNYRVRPGTRESFISYFEDNFIEPHNKLGGYLLGQFRVKDASDNFFWIRGFNDMNSRKQFLTNFYYSSFWKDHKTVPNSLLLNNDNVYLLKPLDVADSSSTKEAVFDGNWFGQDKGLAVVEFFISNTKLDKLVSFVKNSYFPVLRKTGVEHCSFWVSETAPNDFPALPVFQDKNLLVQISFYHDELEYQVKAVDIQAKMTEKELTEMGDLVTIKTCVIVYPTAKSFSTIEKPKNK
jgi:hypothetical protein